VSLPVVTALPAADGPFSERDARLALEIVSGLSKASDVLARYGMTEAQFREKLQNPQFKQLLRDTKQVWQSDLNVKERIRLKAALLVEDSLLGIFRMMGDKDSGPLTRLNAFRELARIASVEEKENKGGGAGSKFVLNITVPGGAQPVVIEGSAEPKGDDGFDAEFANE
jgi:hypothetical protein